MQDFWLLLIIIIIQLAVIINILKKINEKIN